jgi:hypothetical protein
VVTPTPASRLWVGALATRSDDEHSQARDPLRVSWVQVARDSDELASQIAKDLPEFTVHDSRHPMALWRLVDLIAPDDLELTPTEAWTLGIAIILHDLGLAVAAYPGGRKELRALPGWPDARAAAERAERARADGSGEIVSDEELDLQADETVLRDRHAEQGGKLVFAQWNGQYLMTDPDLRDALGSTAGRIAASHWWSVEALSTLGEVEGAPAGMPADWTVRPILLAVLLRLADAAHLDADRAPRFARALRRLGPRSLLHWEFQSRMLQPTINGDRLVFRSSRSFPADQAGAWWLGSDALRRLDEELAATDALLQRHGQPRMKARSVEGVRDPTELARLIRSDGWKPVDARIEVSNVRNLVERLGGRTLYGDTEAVPLRELLQNASDAVQARRALEPGFTGSVEVRVSSDLCELSVCDNGVGMDENVIVGALLDFGRSLWESEELARIHPGLQAAGFKPTGKFGIGFFSVFMWADEVHVVSRGRNPGDDETRVLVFPEGLKGRPLLRKAEEEECLTEPGTRVRLRMRNGERELLEVLGLEADSDERAKPPGPAAIGPLVAKLRSIAPGYEVDLRAVVGDGKMRTVLTGGDWQSIPPDRLLARLTKEPSDELKAEARRMALLGPAEGPSGRIGFSETGAFFARGECALVAGGLRVGTAGKLVGLVCVDQTNAPRWGGQMSAGPDEIAAWATLQASMDCADDEDSLLLSARVLALGGDLGATPLAKSAEGLLNRDQLVEWIGERRRIVLVDVFGEYRANEYEEVTDQRAEAERAADEGEEWEEGKPWFAGDPGYEMRDGALSIVMSQFSGFDDERGLEGESSPAGFEGPSSRSVQEEVMSLAATAWKCAEDEIQVWDIEGDLLEVEDFGTLSANGVGLTPPR